MKVTIDLDIWEEISVDETTEELVIRPRASMMDSYLDFPEEEPEWMSFLETLEEQLIEPYIVPNSNVIPDEEDYHMMVTASKDLKESLYIMTLVSIFTSLVSFLGFC